MASLSDIVAVFETTDDAGNPHTKYFRGTYDSILKEYYQLQNPQEWHLFDVYTMFYDDDFTKVRSEEYDILKKKLTRRVA